MLYAINVVVMDNQAERQQDYTQLNIWTFKTRN